MLGIIGMVLGLIPGLENIASTVLTAHFNAQVAMFQARTGADRDVAVATIQAKQAVLTALSNTPAGQLIYFLFSFPCAAYTAKAILWDNVIASMFGFEASTPPLNGNVGWVYITIVSFWFIHQGINLVQKLKG